MVRRRGEGAAECMLVSQPIQLTKEEWSPPQTIERVRDRGFWLQTGCIVKVFTCGEADGGFWVGLGKMGRERMVRHQGAERGKGWEKIEEEDGRVGEGDFIDVESGGWPCMHLTRCSGRQTREGKHHAWDYKY